MIHGSKHRKNLIQHGCTSLFTAAKHDGAPYLREFKPSIRADCVHELAPQCARPLVCWKLRCIQRNKERYRVTCSDHCSMLNGKLFWVRMVNKLDILWKLEKLHGYDMVVYLERIVTCRSRWKTIHILPSNCSPKWHVTWNLGKQWHVELAISINLLR
jgi:hypothetical protein